ncbi:urease subunit beta [Sinorhizobium meliloti]|nr:urease subunit beta [Sinorhizobium meliloti]
MIPGEIIAAAGEIELNAASKPSASRLPTPGTDRCRSASHYHFAETNPGLIFDRDAARGKRLDIPAVRPSASSPGQTRQVTLIPLSESARFSASAAGHGEL